MTGASARVRRDYRSFPVQRRKICERGRAVCGGNLYKPGTNRTPKTFVRNSPLRNRRAEQNDDDCGEYGLSERISCFHVFSPLVRDYG